MVPDRAQILLVGCGAFAAQAHLPALVACASHIRLAAVVDAAESEHAIRAQCLRAGLPADFVYIGLCRDEMERTESIPADAWGSALPPVDAAIISSSESTHERYVRWALDRRLPTLVDKPLTLHPTASRVAGEARRLVRDYHDCMAAAANVGPFMLAAQRRYQPVYRTIGAYLHQSFKATGWPITFVQCLTNDGLWPHPATYTQHPAYRGGAGKLTHTGYHLLDEIPWLMRHCQAATDQGSPVRRIIGATVHAAMFRPPDAAALHPPGWPRDERLSRLGEVNAGVQVTFHDGAGVICIVQIAALHEGLSLNEHGRTPPTAMPPEQHVFAANAGRTKQDILTVYQGPVRGIFLRRIAKLDGPGSRLGQRDHLELTYASGPQHSPCPPHARQLRLEYQACDSEPTVDFLRALRERSREVASPISDHAIGIKLLAAAYESGITGQTIDVSFGVDEWAFPPAAGTYVARASFEELMTNAGVRQTP